MQSIQESKDNQGNDEAQFAKLSSEIETLAEELALINSRTKKITLINDQVGGWTKRVSAKLTEQLSDSSIPIKQENRTFVEIYRQINDMVVDQLEVIRHDQLAQARVQDDAESEKESINGKEYMNDFATESG